MEANDVLEIGEEICSFLVSCGGPYATLTNEVIKNVYWSLGTGHYVWEPDQYFACYWKIDPADVESVKQRVKPADVTHGTVMYVAEAASKVGLSAMIKRLRKQAGGMHGLFWHRPVKHDKVYEFPSQRGEEA